MADAALAPTRHAVATLRSEGRTSGVNPVGDLRAPTLARAFDRGSADADTPDDDGEGYVLLALRAPGEFAAGPNVREVLAAAVDGPFPVVVAWSRELAHALATAGVEDAVRATCRSVECSAYAPFLDLLDGARCVLTDDVGVGREAFLRRTPCVRLGSSSPWSRSVSNGWTVEAGGDPSTVRAAVRRCADAEHATAPALSADRPRSRLRRVVDAVTAGKRNGRAA